MKIAVTSKGTELDSEIDPRFGRAAYILIVNSDTLDFEVLDNKENINALKGAGIQAATMISDKGAEVLLTGFCGPNAFRTLNAVKIDVVADVNGTIKDAIQDFLGGKYKSSKSANVEGHWS
ncbi:MAG: NifB/NifX family molybdenum-iron cluster-binding protein [Deltaproteobacteria bacterium]|nr:NifB/NifX family molybdenum-iron cluster-binding protein [Deltaproteobacteria bacterium]